MEIGPPLYSETTKGFEGETYASDSGVSGGKDKVYQFNDSLLTKGCVQPAKLSNSLSGRKATQGGIFKICFIRLLWWRGQRPGKCARKKYYPSGASGIWSMEKIPRHRDWDDHYQGRQVRLGQWFCRITHSRHLRRRIQFCTVKLLPLPTLWQTLESHRLLSLLLWEVPSCIKSSIHIFWYILTPRTHSFNSCLCTVGKNLDLHRQARVRYVSNFLPL